MTLKEHAEQGQITEEIKICAKEEEVTEEYIREGLAKGEIVICKNKKGFVKKPCAIGKGLKTKVNVNIGTSKDRPNIEEELKKTGDSFKVFKGERTFCSQGF